MTALSDSLNTRQLTNEEIDFIRTNALERFKYFVLLFISEEWFDDVFHGRVCDFLQYTLGDRLLVLPRTHLKTTLVSLFMLWLATRNTSIRILVVSNTDDNAGKTIHYIKGFVESHPLYQLLFPECIPLFSQVRWSDRCACLNREEEHPEGTFEAAGIGTNVTRRHFDVIVEDDTIAPRRNELGVEELLPSREQIEQAIGFHKSTIPLLITQSVSFRIVVGTRWAQQDLIEHIYTNEIRGSNEGGRFTALDIPALQEDGSPSYKRFSLDDIASIRAGMGHYMFSALYLNKPLPSEAMAFSPDWTVRYTPEQLASSPDGDIIITVDPADPPTGRTDQCYSAWVACKHTHKPDIIFVLKAMRARLSEAALINAVLDMADILEARKIRLEADRYASYEDGFRMEMARRAKHYVIEAVKTRGRAKEARIMALTPYVENGIMRFPTRPLRDLEAEMAYFPHGSTLDVLDALAWQVNGGIRPSYEAYRRPLPSHLRCTTFTFEEIRGSLPDRRVRTDIFGVGERKNVFAVS